MKAKTQATRVPQKLTEIEQDLLWHLQHGYQLETDSRGSNPLLRRVKDQEVRRPTSASRNTVRALEEQGRISATKSRDPLTIIWRVKKTA